MADTDGACGSIVWRVITPVLHICLTCRWFWVWPPEEPHTQWSPSVWQPAWVAKTCTLSLPIVGQIRDSIPLQYVQKVENTIQSLGTQNDSRPQSTRPNKSLTAISYLAGVLDGCVWKEKQEEEVFLFPPLNRVWFCQSVLIQPFCFRADLSAIPLKC